jgi:hypothetical protein
MGMPACGLLRLTAPQGQDVDHPVTECHKLFTSEAPEPRATSCRNAGRHHLGMSGRLRRNPQAHAYSGTQERVTAFSIAGSHHAVPRNFGFLAPSE